MFRDIGTKHIVIWTKEEIEKDKNYKGNTKSWKYQVVFFQVMKKFGMNNSTKLNDPYFVKVRLWLLVLFIVHTTLWRRDFYKVLQVTSDKGIKWTVVEINKP